jgi:hypothetical protein
MGSWFKTIPGKMFSGPPLQSMDGHSGIHLSSQLRGKAQIGR